MIDVRCQYTLTMQLTAPAAAAAVANDNASSSVTIDSVVLIPDYRLSRAYTDAGRCTQLLVCCDYRSTTEKRMFVSHHYRRHNASLISSTEHN